MPERVSDSSKEQSHRQFIGAELPLNDIGVLNQPRLTFDDIPLLAQSIADHGLLHPITVAEFDHRGCQQYIETINTMWHTEHTIGELPTSVDNEGRPVWHVLLAGERRYRACQYLNEKGCVQHQEEAKGPVPCYELHFGSDTIEVRLLRGISAIEALKIQAQENTHKAVPAHEEAHFYAIFFEMMRQQDPEYSLAQCGRDMGRSPSTIRTALRYSLLPESIQEYVQKGQISYGIAVEIARLKEELGISDDELESWVLRTIVNQYKVQDIRPVITKYILDISMGQTVFEFFDREQTRAARIASFKKTAARNLVRGTWENIAYLEQILDLYKQGKIAMEDSPYSLGSPLRVVDAFAEMLCMVVDHLKEAMNEQSYEKAMHAIEEYHLLRQHPTFAQILASLM